MLRFAIPGALLLLALAPVPMRAAQTQYGGTYYYLAPDGNDANDGKTIGKPFGSFWHAQYALQPGDILLVRGGTYKDQLFVPLVDGTPAQPITVQAYPNEKPVITGHSTWGSFVIVTKAHWVIDGLTYQDLIEGPYVFWAHDTHHLTLRNITIRNNPGDMIVLVNCDNVVVENGYFDTTGTPGDFGVGEHIWIAGSRRVLVQNNKFLRAGHASISVIDDNRYGYHSAYNIIRNNVVEQHWGGGIYIANYSHNNVVEGNQITYAGEQDPYTKAGLVISCPDNIVRKNVISKSGSSRQPSDNGLGVYAWDDGWKVQNAVDNRIYNNVVYKSANRGLYFWLKGSSQATRNKFVNNVFYHNKTQQCNEWDCVARLEFSVDSFHTANKWTSFPNENYFFTNVFLAADANGDSPGAAAFSFDYENWYKTLKQVQSDYPKHFKGNVEHNPKFANADSGDFTLQGGSKLINAGSDLTFTVGSGTRTTLVSVEDARFFTDGFGIAEGDQIKVGRGGQAVTVMAVDVVNNVLTVSRPVSYSPGEAVNLPYGGSGPDIGANER